MTANVKLDEKQYIFINEYTEMLSTIDEAFQYVISSFDDYEKTEGDTVLSDIFHAFAQIAESNTLLISIFTCESAVTRAVDRYEEVTKQAMKLDGSFHDQNKKQVVVTESLYPAFKDWKEKVCQEMAIYIKN
ncbi:hypothetical protein V1502_18165 [Bacillus sp. SCS-153A]|uniref:hypothetical protein n=1 Tax=Rossellomorea sedimentorum TaxID=3115294 RepID=UPI003906C9E9